MHQNYILETERNKLFLVDAYGMNFERWELY